MGREIVDPLAKKTNLAVIGSERAADEIEQRRLSRSVRAHHADDLSWLNRQAYVLHGRHAAKPLGDVIESEKGH